MSNRCYRQKMGRFMLLFLLATSLFPLKLSYAATMDFRFSFLNVSYGGGLIEGFVRGLENNATSSATSIEVTANPLGYGIGEYVGDPNPNTFTVVDGSITESFIGAFGVSNTAPDVTCCSLGWDFYPTVNRAGLSSNDSSNTLTPNSSLQFSLVPLPAAAWLFGSGLIGLVCIARRRTS